MSYTIVGLFSSPIEPKNVSKIIENKGFKDRDYIVYINETKLTETKKSNKIHNMEGGVNASRDGLTICTIAINNDEELNLAKMAFTEIHADNVTVLDDVNFEKAKNLDYIKKILDMKAKILIYTMPEFKIFHPIVHTGIDSEVK